MTTPRPAIMRQAIELALDGVRRNQGGPFGAVIVRGDDVIATGCNQVTSWNDPTAHAEIVAIRRACEQLRDFQLAGCELYTTCEPCPMCLAAAYWARLDRVVYACDRSDAARAGFDDAHLYGELSKPAAGRDLPLHQCLREEALVAFEAWLARPDRTPY